MCVPSDHPDAYPRPQLRRRHWTSLDGTWRFRYDDAARLRRPGDIDEWPQSIRVPFPPESKASGIGDRGFHAVCWYQRDFELRPDGGRVLLHFGAVDYEARVWVNDAVVATHEGGHTPFSADITSALRDSGAQTVTVRVRGRSARSRPSRAASRTGSSSRTRSGIRAPPASGRRCGWSACRAPISTRSAGRRTSGGFAISFEARVVGEPRDRSRRSSSSSARRSAPGARSLRR